MSAASDEIRRSFNEGDTKRDAGLTLPSDVERFEDIRYGEDGKWNTLDVYRPKETENTELPVIVSVHGGAWVYGDKERYRFYCNDLAKRGFAVVNFSYRLAPEAKFPAPIEDTNAVFSWLSDNAAKYRLDKGKLFAVGDSAGANILGIYANLLTNPEYAKRFEREYGIEPAKDINLRAVALNCGKYDLSKSEGEDQRLGQLFSDIFPQGGSVEELNMSNVTEHVTENFPNSYIMSCFGDHLKNQAKYLIDAFIEKGVPFTCKFYGSSRTPLSHVFHCNLKLAEAKECNDNECRFFKGL